MDYGRARSAGAGIGLAILMATTAQAGVIITSRSGTGYAQARAEAQTVTDTDTYGIGWYYDADADIDTYGVNANTHSIAGQFGKDVHVVGEATIIISSGTSGQKAADATADGDIYLTVEDSYFDLVWTAGGASPYLVITNVTQASVVLDLAVDPYTGSARIYTNPGDTLRLQFDLDASAPWGPHPDGAGSYEWFDLSFIGIPAPATLALLALGGLRVTRRRR